VREASDLVLSLGASATAIPSATIPHALPELLAMHFVPRSDTRCESARLTGTENSCTGPLEPALVNMPLTRRMAMGVITHRVHCCEPAKEPAHFAVFTGLQDQVPMVGQQLIRQDRNFILLQPFGKDSFERRVAPVGCTQPTGVAEQ
jgi:hypothetical protein